LTRKFKDELKIYQQAQRKYKKGIQTKTKRQIHVIKPDITDEEVEAVMRSEGGRDGLYQKTILRNRAGNVKNDQIK
jgi:t-SNARE complex subunit (syntaxin)